MLIHGAMEPQEVQRITSIFGTLAKTKTIKLRVMTTLLRTHTGMDVDMKLMEQSCGLTMKIKQ